MVQAQKPQNTKQFFADTLDLLNRGNISLQGLLPYSSNYTFLVRIEHMDSVCWGVYKPRRGERPLWDFPQGTLYRREAAAYLVSEMLRFSFVPPTVVRDGVHGIGSLQLFIHHHPEDHLLTIQQEPGFEEPIQQLAAFDYLINNADRKSGHCLKGQDNRFWAIDHGICFHHEYKLRTVLWDFAGQPFPTHVLHALHHFHDSLNHGTPNTKRLAKLLHPMEFAALRERLKMMLETGIYPQPKEGVNIPWPPV